MNDPTPTFDLRLAVIGHVPHWVDDKGEVWAYEPYVREMHVWANLFRHLEICCARGVAPMKGNIAPFSRRNISWTLIPYTYGLGWRSRLKRVAQWPRVFYEVWRTIKRSDFVLLRSPGHFGLAGAILVRVLRRASITKWAGPNGRFSSERIPDKIERHIQGIPSPRHVVLVYGPSKRSHQVSFLPALMTKAELDEARSRSQSRRWTEPFRILAVGRLVPDKDFDVALRALAVLAGRWPNLDWKFTLVGDGYMRDSLEDLAKSLGVSHRVTFAGSKSFQDVQRLYSVAHIVVMPGTNEGWPKVIAEAWAHGAVPVAPAVGIIPSLFAGSAEDCLYGNGPGSLAARLAALMSQPSRLAKLSADGYQSASSLSLDNFAERLTKVLSEECGLAQFNRLN